MQTYSKFVCNYYIFYIQLTVHHVCRFLDPNVLEKINFEILKYEP